jgi:hypothetical protein
MGTFIQGDGLPLIGIPVIIMTVHICGIGADRHNVAGEHNRKHSRGLQAQLSTPDPNVRHDQYLNPTLCP